MLTLGLSIGLLLVRTATFSVSASAVVRRQSNSNATTTGSPSNGTTAGNTTSVPTRVAFGLREDGMTLGTSGINVGFLVDWSYQSPIDLNQQLGKAASVQGDYINVASPDDDFSQIGYHFSPLRRLAGVSVYAPAIIPGFPLAQWTNQTSQNLADACSQLNRAGISVWLRFAYEQNGYWNDKTYGLMPDLYVATWKSLTEIVRATTNETYMLWSPNVFGGDVDSVQGYTPYYAGADYVDLAGLSFYSLGDDQTQNTVPSSNLFTSLFQSFYNLYSGAHWLVISETSAPFHYDLPPQFSNLSSDSELPGGPGSVDYSTLTPAEGGATEYEMKSAWIHQLVGQDTADRFPKLLAVSLFNYVKVANGSSGSGGLLNDYRAVAAPDSNITAYFRTLIGNQTAFDQGYKGSPAAPRPSAALAAWLLVSLATAASFVAAVA